MSRWNLIHVTPTLITSLLLKQTDRVDLELSESLTTCI